MVVLGDAVVDVIASLENFGVQKQVGDVMLHQ